MHNGASWRRAILYNGNAQRCVKGDAKHCVSTGGMYGIGVIGMGGVFMAYAQLECMAFVLLKRIVFFMGCVWFDVIPNIWDVPGRGTMLRVSFSKRYNVVFDNDAM